MGVQALQNYLESDSAPGACVPVDLLRLVRTTRNKHRPNKNATTTQQQQQQRQQDPPGLSLVVDAECCLDRLYGGFFSDWACGGQWNRMVQFLATLITTVQDSNVQLTFFFNGAMENQRMAEWVDEQLAMRQKINSVLRHVSIKGTPPPKIWWTPPVCLRTCLRMALRHLNVGLACSMDDHHQEVIAYCRENTCSGVMADDGEYAVFDPPRYFSSEQIKLTYKGSLETKEFLMSELTKVLGVSGDRLCVLASLLGNYLLGQHEMADIYNLRLGFKEPPGKIPNDQLIKSLCGFVKTLPAPDQLDALTEAVFGSMTDKRVARFQQSVKYYLNGTKDGFLSYKPQHSARRSDKSATPKSSKPTPAASALESPEGGSKKESDELLDYSRLASEADESQEASMAAYREAATFDALAAPQIVIDPPTQPAASPSTPTPAGKMLNGTSLLSSSSSSSSSGAASPSHLNAASEAKSDAKPAWLVHVPHEVLRTVCERHEKGLMSPLIYQIFTQGEIKFPVVMEDEVQREVPAVQQFYRPVRQLVYAILFNIHHHKYMASKSNAASKSPEEGPRAAEVLRDVSALHVKEWTWSRENPYRSPDRVAPEPLCWGVPTIQRLWFGSSTDDKRRRMRAFLTCMRSDSQLVMNPAYVPQHLLVMATVLRYIMSHTDKMILRKAELDAFIAQAFSPDLMDAQELQDLQLPPMSARGIQLAALFMAGADTALLANDACGAPIPWLMCCPWLHFDGKLFHYKLSRTDQVKNLLELCDHRIDVVVKVERMRKAILEGLDYKFLQLQLPHVPVRHNGLPPPPGALLTSGLGPRMKLPGMPNFMPAGASRGAMLRRSVPARGGQLEIAGVVVGQWGANYGTRQQQQPRMPHARHHAVQPPPQVTSVGGVKNYRGSYNGYARPSYTVARGRAGTAQPAVNNKRGTSTQNAGNNRKKKSPKGRGVTIETANGKSVPITQLSVIPTPLKSGDVTSLVGQFEDAVNLGGAVKVNGQELGQGDVSLK